MAVARHSPCSPLFLSSCPPWVQTRIRGQETVAPDRASGTKPSFPKPTPSRTPDFSPFPYFSRSYLRWKISTASARKSNYYGRGLSLISERGPEFDPGIPRAPSRGSEARGTRYQSTSGQKPATDWYLGTPVHVTHAHPHTLTHSTEMPPKAACMVLTGSFYISKLVSRPDSRISPFKIFNCCCPASRVPSPAVKRHTLAVHPVLGRRMSVLTRDSTHLSFCVEHLRLIPLSPANWASPTTSSHLVPHRELRREARLRPGRCLTPGLEPRRYSMAPTRRPAAIPVGDWSCDDVACGWRTVTDSSLSHRKLEPMVRGG